MRRFAWFSLVLVSLVLAVPAHAQTTISSRSADIRLGGRIHAQYASSSMDNQADPFFFRRVRLIADITVNDFFDARLQPDFAGGHAALQDAYVRFRISPALEVSMGQFKRAFDLFELSSSTDLSVIERDGRVAGADGCGGVGGVCSYSRLTEKLGFAGRDQGVRLVGSSGPVSYQASITNGTGLNVSDDNSSKSYSGRVTADVGSGIRVSGQLGLHDHVTLAERNEHAMAWGADVEYGRWREGFHVLAALVMGDNWRVVDSQDQPASFLTAQGIVSYYIPRSNDPRIVGLEPVFRLSSADPNTDLDGDGGLVFTPGLMLYVVGKNKIGLNVDVYSPQTGPREYSFKVQSFLYF